MKDYRNHLQEYGDLIGIYDPIRPLISPEAGNESTGSNRLAAIVRGAVNSLTDEQLSWERQAIADTLLNMMSQTFQAELEGRRDARQALPTPSDSLSLIPSSSMSLGRSDSSPAAPRLSGSDLQPAVDEPVQPIATVEDVSNQTSLNAPSPATSTSNSVTQPCAVLEQSHSSTQLPGKEANNAAILDSYPEFYEAVDIAIPNGYVFCTNSFSMGFWDDEVVEGFSEEG